LLLKFTNLGRPTIKVKSGNYGNKGELSLIHEFNGVNLHLEDGKDVLKNIYEMWGRPVNLKTVRKERAEGIAPKREGEEPGQKVGTGKAPAYEGVKIRYDGERFQREEVEKENYEELIYETGGFDTVPQGWRS